MGLKILFFFFVWKMLYFQKTCFFYKLFLPLVAPSLIHKFLIAFYFFSTLCTDRFVFYFSSSELTDTFVTCGYFYSIPPPLLVWLIRFKSFYLGDTFQITLPHLSCCLHSYGVSASPPSFSAPISVSGVSSCPFPLSALAVSALQAYQGEAQAKYPLPPR